MVKVITYGTYDLLHFGHIRLLKRAKDLGDYLIVGVTADDFDKTRGKINVQQTLMERVEAVRATGIADEIIIEEYEGQKIDDIKRHDVDIFTVGSDWVGKFDYLNEYCKVVYLDRTQGISSTELRSEKRSIRFGLVGGSRLLIKHLLESHHVNGLEVAGLCTADEELRQEAEGYGASLVDSFENLVETSDAVYIVSHPTEHYAQIRYALERGKHVLCESPITLKQSQCEELFALAQEKGLILMEALKTAYATAFNRLTLLLKSGKIGQVVSVDAVCTSLRGKQKMRNYSTDWNSICAWGPTAMLPVFEILGVDYRKKTILSKTADAQHRFDDFTKVDFIYDNAVASIRVGKGVKSEGELVVTGTEGYVYVPAPWWKTDYFEIRYEDSANNRRYFYQLDGEGIRYELVAFAKAIQKGKQDVNLDRRVSMTIAEVIESYYNKTDYEDI